MLINKVTGQAPAEVHVKPEKSEHPREQVQSDSAKKPEEANAANKTPQVTADVSDRSRAAIKAYRLAMDSKPAIARAARIAQIKAQVINGTYQIPSNDVATAVLESIVGKR